MDMVSLIDQYMAPYLATYSDKILPSHLKALHAIKRCRTPQSGELYIKCPDCDHAEWRPLSCGNRHCPKCQNHASSNWIDKQQNKLLPVTYFMVTFTVPYEMRPLVYQHQKDAYKILFDCAISTLKSFGHNSKRINGDIGATLVLHTHSRKLDYHPHIHAVVPGGGINKRTLKWRQLTKSYLFNHKALAKVFRARFLTGLKQLGIPIPENISSEWVVDCTETGKGLSAIKYLSRYLYRGVISEKNIVSNKGGIITFTYLDNTGTKRYRKIKGENFLHLIMQHVLPTGFRRVRDYGFLHGNAKKILVIIQLILRVLIIPVVRSRPAFKCRHCEAEMFVLAMRRYGGWAG